MEEALRLPLLGDILPGGLRFGANYLVEFEPQSLWYETSLTLTAQALKAGHKSDYHTFTHTPDDVKAALTRQGVEVKRLQDNDTFRIWDSYAVQGGIEASAKIGMANPRERVDLRSVKMSDWNRGNAEELKAGLPEIDTERLHIDDNTSVLLQYNSEKEVIDHFRTITVQHARKSKLAAVHSLISGIYSDNFYRQFESFCDGIIDFKTTEENGRLTQGMRIRFLRGLNHDSRWRSLALSGNGEVALGSPAPGGEKAGPSDSSSARAKSSVVDMPFFSELIPGGIEFGSIILVEFEPESCWYEAANTLASQALAKGLKTDLHVFQHNPKTVREAMGRFGLDLKKLEDGDFIRFIDSYSVQVGVGKADVPKGADAFKTSSVRLEDWAKAAAAQMSTEIPESEKNRVHIDDNTAILSRYNNEEELIDYWRTKIIPLYRTREDVLINAVALGVASDRFYKQHESMVDGIIDCKSKEVDGVVEHYIRVRAFRGKDPDTRWQRVKILDGRVVFEREAQGPRGATGSKGDEKDGARQLLASTDSVPMETYRVVGKYMRFNPRTRNALKDARQRIVASVGEGFGVENFLVWGIPGSGKSYFVQEVARQLGATKWRELNLAQLDEIAFRRELADLSSESGSMLVFVDEIDSKPTETWQYEALLPAMEKPRPGARTCFILAGSGGSDLKELRDRVGARPKGRDLLSRVSPENDLTIPQLEIGDKMVVAIVQLIGAARERGLDVREVEKLALYYVMLNEQLSSPRRLRQFVQAVAERIPEGEDRVKYDYLFRAGDPLNKEFWLATREAHGELANQFIRVADLAEQTAPVGQKLRGAGKTQVEEPRPDAKRIAVLPLDNYSPDKNDDYFADGMTEELISAVSKVGGVRVIARTTAMRLKGTDKSIEEIGKELNVGTVLQGSVRKSGDKIRITMRLVETSSEELRWSQDYDRELKDVFAIQSDISRLVAGALRADLAGGAVPESKATSNMDAYVEYLRGRQLWGRMNAAGLKESLDHFRKALELDPRFASAYAGLADSYAWMAILEFMPSHEAFSNAKEAAEHALSIEPNLAEARTSLALIRFQNDWDWAGAEEEFRHAVALKPSYALAHRFFSDYLKAMGRFEEALEEIRRAQELDPLSVDINSGYGHVLYLSHRIDDAIAQYRMTVDLDPNAPVPHIWFGRPYLEKGMYPEAVAELETAVRLTGESTLALAMLGHALGAAGRFGEAQAILQKLLERSQRQYVASYWVAQVYNGMKEKAEVVEWLGRALEERSAWLVWANVEPRFDWLRQDPGFAAIMNAMKFP